MKKIRMPRNKKEYIQSLKNAFHAGCIHEDYVAHEKDVELQRELGAQEWVGEITREEMYAKIDEIILEGRK